MSFEFLMAISQWAHLWAANGQFLGVLSSNQSDPYSISNLHGIYGSYMGKYSMRNSHSLYGSTDGKYSAYNPEGLNPPIVFYQEQPILVVTKNHNIKKYVNGLRLIDPDLLLVAYFQVPINVPRDEESRDYDYTYALN